MSDQLTALNELAAMQHDAAMADLSRHNRAIQALDTRISELRARLYSTPSTEQGDALPLSLTSGHYDTWQRWAERELAKLNTDLARARAEREAFVAAARLAFGRKSATDALLKQQKDEKRIAARKRLEHNVSDDQLGKKPLSF
ncbi:hypothetical protein MUY35_16185 [Aliiroseovarius sp. S1339]|uniref:hypothetical protein n=1 Tax=Aliiroseovarius sp. S1339 TaxID=2936990 RepID=UPI0020C000A8|nr:hypothetical protein [Aliiroseovarius sp. S1339]MCK8465399.1 hypothetical protein [Aliiroseovarius sp. S1339]